MALKNARHLLSLSQGAVSLQRCQVHRDSTFSSPALPLVRSRAENPELPTPSSTLFLDRPHGKNMLIKAFENNRSDVAIIEQNEEFLYEDLLRRGFDLAKIIKDLFKYEERSTDHKICFLCPDGVSFLLSTLACWLSGNTAVPLSECQREEVVQHALSQNSSPFVIVTSELQDKIRSLAKANNRQIVVLDSSWTKGPVQSFRSEDPLPSLFNENFYHGDRSGMVLYTAGTSSGVPTSVSLNHCVIDSRLQKTVGAWGLTNTDITLHAIPMNSHFSIVDALLAPMSIGGKVVSIKTTNPTKIWSHLLGFGMNTSQSLPKTNFFPSTPKTYCKLLKSHQDLFHNPKIRDYVKTSCTKKIRSMTCGGSSLPPSIKNKWKAITGHTIVETYTKTQVGTVLCGDVCKPELASKNDKNSPQDYCKPLPGTELRVIRFTDCNRVNYDVLLEDEENAAEGVVGELLLRIWDYHIEDADSEGWYSTRDIVRLKGGAIQVIGKILCPSLKRFKTIERHFTKYPGIMDCYVFGMDQSTSTEMGIAAALVIDPNLEKSTLDAILTECKKTLGPADVPSIFKTISEVPLDSRGRVSKIQVAEAVFQGKLIPKLYFEDFVL